jgi:uncharacterized protein (TIGR02246 family)
MRRSWIIMSMLAVACAKPADDASVSQAGTSEDRAAVQAAIDAQLARFTAALERGDTAGLASAYADDAWVMAPGAPLASGRAAIAQMNAGMFSALTISSASIKTSDLILSGDYAIESGTYSMKMKPKTGNAFDDVGKYLAVWQKQPDGSWKMIRDIWNSNASPQ